MTVTVLYFASVREKLGRDREQVELAADSMRVADLATQLAARGAPWAEALSAKHLKVAVNHAMVGMDAAIKSGDEVAFFPPVTGG